MAEKVIEQINDALSVFVEEEPDVTTVENELLVMDKDERTVDIKNDYDKRREVIYSLLEKGSKALDSSLALATGSMHPRAFEVTGQLLKVVADVAKDLTDLQKDMNKIEGIDNSGGVQKVVNNAIFIGSTTELLKTLRDNNV